MLICYNIYHRPYNQAGYTHHLPTIYQAPPTALEILSVVPSSRGAGSAWAARLPGSQWNWDTSWHWHNIHIVTCHATLYTYVYCICIYIYVYTYVLSYHICHYICIILYTVYIFIYIYIISHVIHILCIHNITYTIWNYWRTRYCMCLYIYALILLLLLL
jgi:hypothetical protein